MKTNNKGAVLTIGCLAMSFYLAIVAIWIIAVLFILTHVSEIWRWLERLIGAT